MLVRRALSCLILGLDLGLRCAVSRLGDRGAAGRWAHTRGEHPADSYVRDKPGLACCRFQGWGSQMEMGMRHYPGTALPRLQGK